MDHSYQSWPNCTDIFSGNTSLAKTHRISCQSVRDGEIQVFHKLKKERGVRFEHRIISAQSVSSLSKVKLLVSSGTDVEN